jgi:UDP-3-O-[3-hydroxymyristoyl] glucosamine N-acyltransferase
MKFETPKQVTELAALVDAEVVGDSGIMVTGIADVGRATNGDLTFAENDRFLRMALDSAASVILINTELAFASVPNGKTILRVPHAQHALNRIATENFSRPQASKPRAIHRTAIIGAKAKIHDDCSIGAYCVIGNNVSISSRTRLSASVTIEDDCVIGEGCEIGSHTVIHHGTHLSDNVIIQGGCHIGTDPAYYYKLSETLNRRRAFGSVHIGPHVHIGAGSTIARGVSGNTVIGDETKLDNQIHIGHDAEIGRRVRIAAHTGIAGYVRVHDDVIIRGHVGIMQYVTIGKGAEILGKSGVDLDIPDNQTVFGIPAITRDRYAQRRRAVRKRIRQLEKEIKPALRAEKDVRNRVFQTVADEAGKEISEINLSQILTTDLQFDSLDLVELQTALEEEFDLDVVKLRLDTHAFDDVKTIGDIVEVVKDSLTPR